MNTRTQPPPSPLSHVHHHHAPASSFAAPLSEVQLRDLKAELRREYALAERELSYGGSSLELHELREAIQRLKAGAYGVCTACHQPIPFARLQVMPATQRCVGCPR